MGKQWTWCAFTPKEFRRGFKDWGGGGLVNIGQMGGRWSFSIFAWRNLTVWPQIQKSYWKLLIRMTINLEANKEEAYWVQWARANWLKNGDYNTTFFHIFSSLRKWTNQVVYLKDGSGNRDDHKDMATIARDYFINLFGSSCEGNLSHSLSYKIIHFIFSIEHKYIFLKLNAHFGP